MKNVQQGFTLIERMIAVAIIGIVAPLCASDVNAQTLKIESAWADHSEGS
jgi:prepilin-type N-terminal cleavage/methylation domain-containing protein